MRVFESLDDFSAAVGQQLGAGQWYTVDQAQIDAFADAVAGGDRPACTAEAVLILASTTP